MLYLSSDRRAVRGVEEERSGQEPRGLGDDLQERPAMDLRTFLPQDPPPQVPLCRTPLFIHIYICVCMCVSKN
jgi:hypothetical protein